MLHYLSRSKDHKKANPRKGETRRRGGGQGDKGVVEYANLQGRKERALETGVFDIPVEHFSQALLPNRGFKDLWEAVMLDVE